MKIGKEKNDLTLQDYAKANFVLNAVAGKYLKNLWGNFWLGSNVSVGKIENPEGLEVNAEIIDGYGCSASIEMAYGLYDGVFDEERALTGAFTIIGSSEMKVPFCIFRTNTNNLDNRSYISSYRDMCTLAVGNSITGLIANGESLLLNRDLSNIILLSPTGIKNAEIERVKHLSQRPIGYNFWLRYKNKKTD